MEKGPHKAARDLVRLELHPPLKVEDFKSKPHPRYESAGALASRMIIETSSAVRQLKLLVAETRHRNSFPDR
jgi:hypothetical protein